MSVKKMATFSYNDQYNDLITGRHGAGLVTWIPTCEEGIELLAEEKGKRISGIPLE